MKIERVNKAQRMTNAMFEKDGYQPRVNAAERGLIRQGAMTDPRQPAAMPRPPVTGGQTDAQRAVGSAVSNLTAPPATPWANNLPTQKLPDILPDGSTRRPGDPNQYFMGPDGQMGGTLIGWPGMNEKLAPENLPPIKFGTGGTLNGKSLKDRLDAYYAYKGGAGGLPITKGPLMLQPPRSNTISPGIGMNGKPINYGGM